MCAQSLWKKLEVKSNEKKTVVEYTVLNIILQYRDYYIVNHSFDSINKVNSRSFRGPYIFKISFFLQT